MDNCSIYLIYNRINGKRYIGQSIDAKRRWREHKSDLNCNKHCNPYLQKAFNKYGEDAFEFKILHICQESELDGLEEFYLKIANQFYDTYNIDDVRHGSKRRSVETRNKISKAVKGLNKGKKMSSEFKENRRKYMKGKTYRRIEFSDKQVNEILNLAQSGIAKAEIARRFGYSPPTIHRVLLENKCKR